MHIEIFLMHFDSLKRELSTYDNNNFCIKCMNVISFPCCALFVGSPDRHWAKSVHRGQTGKFVFRARKIFFPHQICALGKTVLASPLHMNWYIFQACFSNFARLIGCCARGNLLVRGRSLAHTTYFPVWHHGENSLHFILISLYRVKLQKFDLQTVQLMYKN